MRPAKMTQGSNSRIGIAAGRAAAGANVEAVISNSWGIRVPIRDALGSRSRSDSRPKTTDHSGATVPDLHRLPRLKQCARRQYAEPTRCQTRVSGEKSCPGRVERERGAVARA